MKRIASILTVLLIGAMLTSCISKKKHEEAMASAAAAAAAEKAALEKSLDEANQATEKLQGEYAKVQENLNMSAKEIEELSQKIKDNNAKIDRLRNAITEVFSTYDPNQVNVMERNGKLYISMANSILFRPGHADIHRDSRDVVKQLAEVFKMNGDLDIVVEGHTDSDPIKIHKKYRDNWNLSVARSISVVRMLIDNGMAETRLTASGKGDTQPIADNSTKAGKETNRRTEFVVTPKIDGLYKMYKEEIMMTKGEGEGIK